jgi:very-short-patch-repair endonuclease
MRRPDFIVYPRGRPIVIEVDGHEYHRTREQRTADAQRERWLTAQGFDFMRFTGTEVWADAQRCVRELRAWIGMRQTAEPQ